MQVGIDLGLRPPSHTKQQRMLLLDSPPDPRCPSIVFVDTHGAIVVGQPRPPAGGTWDGVALPVTENQCRPVKDCSRPLPL